MPHGTTERIAYLAAAGVIVGLMSVPEAFGQASAGPPLAANAESLSLAAMGLALWGLATAMRVTRTR